MVVVCGAVRCWAGGLATLLGSILSRRNFPSHFGGGMSGRNRAMKKTKAKASDTVGTTQLVQLDLRIIEIKIEGTSPLITHAWSEKTKRAMLDKMMGKASKGKEKRDPIADYEAAFYRLPSGEPAFPMLSIKNAAVTAVTSLGKEFTKVAARQAFHFLPTRAGGELVEIHFPSHTPPRMREDTVRVGMGSADLRYRPEFLVWGIIIKIQYNARAVSQEQVVNLLNLGGFSVGIGEWRPEKDGDRGRFSVVNKFSWSTK